MKRLAVGALTHPMVFEEPTGQTADGYTPIGETWWAARVLASTGGNETLRFGVPGGLAQYVFKGRYRAGVKTEWRMREGTEIYQINAHGDPDGRREQLHVFATELQ